MLANPEPSRMMARLHLDKVKIIVILLLTIPLSVTILVTWPMPAEFITPGENIPVSEIGVDGSVHFAVVHAGIAKSLFERWSILLTNRGGYEVEFTSLSRAEAEYYEDTYLETETLTETVEHAVMNLSSLSEDNLSETNDTTIGMIQNRIDELISELEGYYGNSLGLMVAIGLYEEMHDIQFSADQGLKISGTGTMEEEGYVGSIGGLKQKLLGAESEGVDLFFVPADYEWWGEEGNEAEAKRVQSEYELKLKIVPVETLAEAIDYLEQ